MSTYAIIALCAAGAFVVVAAVLHGVDKLFRANNVSDD
jgi:hypothetical protein